MNGSGRVHSGEGGPTSGAQASRVERDAVLRQLELILLDPLFAHSGRYPAFLRYIVEQALAGRQQELKERTIGVAVFHRVADYDTSDDHVVRNVGVEVRKRLLQFYERSGREGDIRIELLPGSYVPQFRSRSKETSPDKAGSAFVGIEQADGSVATAAGLPSPRRRFLSWVAAATAGVAVVVGAVSFWPALRPSPFDRFWAPVWNARATLVICLDGLDDRGGERFAASNGSPSLAEYEKTWDLVRFSDASNLAHLAELAGAKGKSFRVISGRSASYSDLHSGAVILIGRGDGEWLSQIPGSLRYRLKYDGDVASIVDTKSDRTYMVDMNTPYDGRIRDYAIVWRIYGRLGDHVSTGAAGLTRYGAMAATDFLTSRVQLADFARRAGPGWEEKNFEVLLTVTAVKGSTWPPLIIAAELWEPGSTNAFLRETAGKSDRGVHAPPGPGIARVTSRPVPGAKAFKK